MAATHPCMAGRLLSLVPWALLALLACGRPGLSPAKGGDGPLLLSYNKETFKDTLFVGRRLSKAKPGQTIALEFTGCTFAGPVLFCDYPTSYCQAPYNVAYKDCVFEQAVSGGQTSFTGLVRFVNCRFKGLANFANVTFGAPMSFRQCTFDQDANFSYGIFTRDAAFMDCHFFGVGRWQFARFAAPVQFGNTIFHSFADFSLATFEQDAWFDYGKFLASGNFGSARVGGNVSLHATQAKTIKLDKTAIQGKLITAGLVLADSLDVSTATIVGGRQR